MRRQINKLLTTFKESIMENENMMIPANNAGFSYLSEYVSGSSLSRFYENRDIKKTAKSFFKPDKNITQLPSLWWKRTSNAFAPSISRKFYAEIFNQSLVIRKTADLEIITVIPLSIPPNFSYKHNVGIWGVAYLFWKEDEYVCLGYNTGLLEVYDLQGKLVLSRNFLGCFGSGAWNSKDLLVVSLFPNSRYNLESEIGTYLYDASLLVSKGKLILLESLGRKICIPNRLLFDLSETRLLGVSSWFRGERNYDSSIWYYDVQTGIAQNIAEDKKISGMGPKFSEFADDGSYCVSLYDSILVINRFNKIIKKIPLEKLPGYYLIPYLTPDGKNIFIYDYLSNQVGRNYLRYSLEDTNPRFVSIADDSIKSFFNIKTFTSKSTAFGFVNNWLRNPVLVDANTMSVLVKKTPPLLLFCAYGFDRNDRGDIAITTGKPSVQIFDKDICPIGSIETEFDDLCQVCWAGTNQIAITTSDDVGFIKTIHSENPLENKIYKESGFVYRLKNDILWSKHYTIVLPNDIIVENQRDGYIYIIQGLIRIRLKLDTLATWIAGNHQGIFCLSETELRFFGQDCIKEILQKKDETLQYDYIHPLSYKILDNKYSKYERITVTPQGEIFLTSTAKISRYSFDSTSLKIEEVVSKNMELTIIAWHDPWHNRVILNRRICYSFLTNDLEKIADLYLLPNGGYCIHAVAPNNHNSQELHPGYIWGYGDYLFLFECWDEQQNLVIDRDQKQKLLARYINKDMVTLALKDYTTFQSLHLQSMFNKSTDAFSVFKLQLPYID